ncbi:MAG: RHS repeat-associated core domain-containing protein [Patescibacteria group bacterium]
MGGLNFRFKNSSQSGSDLFILILRPFKNILCNCKKPLTLLVVFYFVFGINFFVFAQETTRVSTTAENISKREKIEINQNIENTGEDLISNDVQNVVEQNNLSEVNQDIENNDEEIKNEEERTASLLDSIEIPSPQNKSIVHPEVDQTTGALNYGYKIELPKGINNLTPSVVLRYNSQNTSNDSILGYGWNISIPYIQRQNIHGTDKLYVNNDFLSSVDGELTSIDQDHFAPKTDDGSFHMYSFINNIFSMTDKSGTTYTYGATINERQDDATNSNNIYKWMLTSQTDVNGNTITYTYFKDNGQIYIDNINYAGIYDISFTRENNPFPYKNNSTGFLVKTNYRINSILIKTLNVAKHTYFINYSFGNNGQRSLIFSIYEVGYDNLGTATTLVPTIFSWQNYGGGFSQDSSWTMPTHTSGTGTQYSVLGKTVSYNNSYVERSNKLIDVNGDGLPDWVETSIDDGNYNGIWLGTPTGWVKDSVWTSAMPKQSDGTPFLVDRLDHNMYHYTLLADVNGDGLPDWVESNTYSNGDVWLNNGNGWTLDPTWIWPAPSYSQGNPFYLRFGEVADIGNSAFHYNAKLIDVNNDGLPDVVQSTDNNIGNDHYAVYINNGNGWVLDSNWLMPTHIINGVTYSSSLSSDVNQLMDVNGDNLPDWVETQDTVISGPGVFAEYSGVWLNNGHSWVRDLNWNMPYFQLKDQYGTLQYHDATLGYFGNIYNSNIYNFRNGTLVDVNGDGLPDWMMTSVYDNINPYNGIGEFNNVWLNTGHGWEKDTSWTMLPPTPSCTSSSCFSYYLGNFNSNSGSLFDLNADGLPDWIISGGNTYNTVFINTGNGWAQTTNGTPWHTEFSIYNKGALYGNLDLYDYRPYVAKHRHDVILDVDGDGLSDWVESTFIEDPNTPPSPADIWYGVWKNNGKATDLLSSITLPTGGISSFVYKPQIILDANPRENNQTINTVASVTNTDSVNNISSVTNYEYINGKYIYTVDDNNRKFAGFEKVKTTRPDGSKKIDYYNQGNDSDLSNYEYNDHFSKVGKIYRTDIFDPADNILTRSTTKWEDTNLASVSGDRYFVYPNQTINETFFGTTKATATSSSYDIVNGNLLNTVNFGEVIANDPLNFTDTGTDKKVATIDYATNGTGIYKPSKEIGTDQNGNIFSEVKHYYDNSSLGILSKGLETEKEILKRNNVYVINLYEYDSFGNKISETDSLENKTTYTYDSYNIYPIKLTDALSHENNIIYDYALGKPLSVINENNFENQYLYDGIGRIITIKTPDPNSNSTSDPLVISKTFSYGDIPNAIYILETDNFSPTVSKTIYQYFDGFNRNIQTREYTGNLNQYIVSDTLYDSMGRVSSVSLPYFDYYSNKTNPTIDNNLLINTVYDSLSRIVSKTNILGVTTNSYDGFKTTTIDPLGHSKSNTIDVYGNLINVEENNQGQVYTTNYEYDSNNNLIKIIDALGNVRNFMYDNLGNRTSAEDLHNPIDTTFGVWKYEYDSNNNLIKVTDANQRIINYRYDRLNRIIKEYSNAQSAKIKVDDFSTKKTLNIDQIIYTYDNCLNGVGMLCSVKRSNSSQTDFTYDSLGNIKIENKFIINKNYITENNYNLQGILNKIIYPDNSSTEYGLNENGLINNVTFYDINNNPKILISNIEYGPNKIPSIINYGNGLINTNTFDPSQMYRLINKNVINPQGIYLQNLAYTYDIVGNILNITDISNTNSAKNISYSYDDLYRLTQASAVNTANVEDYAQTFNYDAIGNLLDLVFTLKGKTRNIVYNYTGNQASSYANPNAIIGLNNSTKNQNEYDKNGNLIKDYSNVYKWNYRNEISNISSLSNVSSYLYDESGNRVYEINNSNVKVYPNKYYEDDGSVVMKYIYAGNLLIATIEKDVTNLTDTYHYNISDQVSSSSVISDNTGNIEQVLDYFPYGNLRIDNKSTNFSEHKQFGGHYKDNTGLNYMGARYYNPNYGRFVSQDPMFWSLPKEYLLDPQQMNSYAFARNNPIIYTDPDGKTAVDSINTFVSNTINSVVSSVSNFFGGGNTNNLQVQKNIDKGTTLVDYKGSNFIGKPATVHPDFMPGLKELNGYAENNDVSISVESSGLRNPNISVSGAVATPAKLSNHFIGQAIDVSYIDNTTGISCDFNCFKNGNVPDNVSNLISNIQNSNNLRWGGDFKDNYDPIHIDTGLNVRNPSRYTEIYNSIYKK